jgi:hypothetical protein
LRRDRREMREQKEGREERRDIYFMMQITICDFGKNLLFVICKLCGIHK